MTREQIEHAARECLCGMKSQYPHDQLDDCIGYLQQQLAQAEKATAELRGEVEKWQAHYESALANWNFALDERDNADRRAREECVDLVEIHGCDDSDHRYAIREAIRATIKNVE